MILSHVNPLLENESANMFPWKWILGNQPVMVNKFPWIQIHYITGHPDQNGVSRSSDQNTETRMEADQTRM
jgi:hypothetical protein